MTLLHDAKRQLEHIIRVSDANMGAPIQIAEVLYHSRTVGDVRPLEKYTYVNASLSWRNAALLQLSGKVPESISTSQAWSWGGAFMSSEMLVDLDKENKQTGGAVERYVYTNYSKCQKAIRQIFSIVEDASPTTFQPRELLDAFIADDNLRHSVGRAYEILLRSLFEMVGARLKVNFKIEPSPKCKGLFDELAELTVVLLCPYASNISLKQTVSSYQAKGRKTSRGKYEACAASFQTPQVKHLTLDKDLANEFADDEACDQVIIVCRDADAPIIQAILRKISWGRRVRGIVKEAHLIEWYERCLRGKFKDQLARPLLDRLTIGFKAEFPQTLALTGFLEERGYASMTPPERWKTGTEEALSDR